jgi:hypothetical protein
MGYTTDFRGHIDINPPLTEERAQYLRRFNETRRMKRNEEIVNTLPDPYRQVVGLPVGAEGSYFVGSCGYMGEDNDTSVVDFNSPPQGQPGLWCQWTVNDAGDKLEWDGGEKFYDYVDWLQYLITHFYTPWGYTLNGAIEWRGEDWDDTGTIMVVNNAVSTLQ